MKTKGCLEVRAVRDTRMGTGDRVVPAGSIGFVIGQRPGERVVWWKTIGPDWHGVHPAADLEPTGNRGK